MTDLSDLPADASPSIERVIVARDLARKVLASVPEKVRVVALLRHGDGLHDAEVAAALGVGRRTVVYRLEAFRQKAARRVANEQ